jgi:hypothetical protein
MCVRGLIVGVILAMAVGTARAQVQVPEGFAIERFQLATDRAGLIDVEWADVPRHLSWGVGLWTGFAHDPLVIYDRNNAAVDALVKRRLTTGVVGSIGLWDRLELALGLDVVDNQATGTPMTALPSGGASDLRFAAKLRVYGTRHLVIAAIPAVTIPMGSATGYLREPGPTFEPEVAIGFHQDRVRVATNIGYRVREQVTAPGLVIGNELFLRTGAGMRLDDKTELMVSTSFAMPTHNVHRNELAVELLLGASRRLTSEIGLFVAGGLGLDNGFGTPDWRAVAGARYDATSGDRDGDGVIGAADRCPDEPEDKDGFQDSDGCPDPDNDGDGILDAADKCPNEAEDKDGWQDEDGCPDPDNDKDGILDAADKCPNQPEDKDGFEDEDGCPDPDVKIDGHVVDPDGRPIVHATVRIAYVDHPDLPIVEVAADDGNFTATVQGAAVKVTAQAPEYQDNATEARLGSAPTARIDITLSRKIRQGQLRGQVRSFDGKLLSATIKVTGGKTTTSAQTDAEGSFTVDLPEGSYEVVIESDGYATQRRTVSVKLDGVTVLNADLRGTK